MSVHYSLENHVAFFLDHVTFSRVAINTALLKIS